MANDPSKTEQATPKRRNKARSEGQVAKSAEVNQTAVLLATLVVLAMMAPKMLARCEGVMRDGLSQIGRPSLIENGAGLSGIAAWGMHATFMALLPIMIAAAFAGIISSVAQVGFKFSAKAIKPSFSKMNPAKGLKQLFSPAKVTELVKSMAKLIIVGAVGGSALWSRLPKLGLIVGMPPGALLVNIAHLVFSIAIRVVGALIVIAAFDFIHTKHKFQKNMKMTKQEVKMEAREADLPPEIKGKIRGKQMELARKRMFADVPTADVVVVNPTHFAVALRYDGSKAAPEVIAKGADHVARRIREIAEESGVTIVREPPLARTLYRDVEVGDQIPEELFGAVAEVLAFVFRTARRRGQRRLNAA